MSSIRDFRDVHRQKLNINVMWLLVLPVLVLITWTAATLSTSSVSSNFRIRELQPKWNREAAKAAKAANKTMPVFAGHNAIKNLVGIHYQEYEKSTIDWCDTEAMPFPFSSIKYETSYNNYNSSFKMMLHHPENDFSISGSLFNSGGLFEWKSHLKNIMTNFLDEVHKAGNKDPLIVDVGANIGTNALWLSSLGYRVHAFEPLVRNFALLHCSYVINPQLHKNMWLSNVGMADAERSGVCMKYSEGSKGEAWIRTGWLDLPFEYGEEYYEEQAELEAELEAGLDTDASVEGVEEQAAAEAAAAGKDGGARRRRATRRLMAEEKKSEEQVEEEIEKEIEAELAEEEAEAEEVAAIEEEIEKELKEEKSAKGKEVSKGKELEEEIEKEIEEEEAAAEAELEAELEADQAKADKQAQDKDKEAKVEEELEEEIEKEIEAEIEEEAKEIEEEIEAEKKAEKKDAAKEATKDDVAELKAEIEAEEAVEEAIEEEIAAEISEEMKAEQAEDKTLASALQDSDAVASFEEMYEDQYYDYLSECDEYNVNLITLDWYWENKLRKEQITLLKIDVEGYEDKVLKGGRKLFAEAPPQYVLMEMHPHGQKSYRGDPEQFYHSVRGMGYHIVAVDGREIDTDQWLELVQQGAQVFDTLWVRSMPEDGFGWASYYYYEEDNDEDSEEEEGDGADMKVISEGEESSDDVAPAKDSTEAPAAEGNQ